MNTTNCVSCGAPLAHIGAKFCTKCGAKQPEEEPTASAKAITPVAAGMTVVKQRVCWNIGTGQIAYRLNEAEFVNYDNVLGLIINDGTTAYIRSNGETICELHGGSYDFISPEELDKLLETRVSEGIAGVGKRVWRGIVNFIMGKKVRDNIADSADDNLAKLKSLDAAIEHLKRKELLSVTLKQDREFQLLLGENHDGLDEFANFVPMKIRTKYHDVSVSIRAYFQIVDFAEFASFYLSDRDTVRTSLLAKMVTPLVKATVQESLAGVALDDTLLPQALTADIERRLKAINFHGIALKSVVEITANNADLERMHQLARDMYLSEQELEQLNRTNDFKNRLATTVAQQRLHEAQTELDIYNSLQAINKDKLVSDDELQKFYIVLSRERRIFEAQSALTEAEADEKIHAALADMERTGLLRQEETDILNYHIKEREYQRGYATRLMQLKDAIEYERVRTGNDQQVRLQALMAELELVKAKDNYADERFYKALEQRMAERDSDISYQRKQQELQNEQTKFDYDLAERAQKAQMDRYEQLERLEDELEEHSAERKRKEMELQNAHDLRMKQEEQQTIRERERAHQQMSAEQIAAQRIAELTPEAQEAYFQSLSAGKDLEQERNLRKEQGEFLKQQQQIMQQSQSENMDRMQSMMNNMMSTMATMSGNMVQNRNEQKEEYREELHKQQVRHDMHQDQALNYTTRYPQTSTVIMPAANGAKPVTTPPAPQTAPQPAGGSSAEETSPKGTADAADYKECPQCHKRYGKDDKFCGDCGCFI